MASLTHVFVDVLPSVDKFDNQMRSKLSRIDASRSGQHVGSSFGKGFARSFASLATGLFAGIGLARLFTTFISEGQEARKISAITANAIRATGGAAKISAEQVAELAESISNKTAVDDEQIQSNANVLLTFKNIRNEAGKGNDIFNQATAAVSDLSVALKTDMRGASIQLGKALNDPIKGMTALSRAGVQFTAQQKEQIKTLVESGDVLGAQKIILAEISGQMGGAAEAAATPLDKLKTVALNLAESVGTFLLPHIDSFANFLIDKGIPKVKEIAKTFKDEWIPPIKAVAGFIRENASVIVPLVAGIGVLVGIIKIATAVTAAYNVVLLLNPFVAVAALVLALGAALVVAYKKSETFRDIVKGVWEAVSDAVSFAWNSVIEPTIGFIGDAVTNLIDFWEDLQETVEDVWDAIVGFVREAVADVVETFLGFVGAIIDGAAEAFGWVPGLGGKLKTASKDFEKFKTDVNRSLRGISDEDINIKVFKIASDTRSTRFAEGGPIRGRGSGTSDSNWFRGSNGEHVLTAAEVRAAGGHGAIFALRKMLLRGGGGGFAAGGPVDFDIRTRGLSAATIAQLATDFVRATRDEFVRKSRAMLAKAEDPGSGRFAFPLPRGRYRVGRGTAGHGYPAQDFPAPVGTPVFAPFAGSFTPVRLGNRSYGNYANIVAGSWRSIQAHLRGFARGAGHVDIGELVGFVDSTGNSTGHHLHQEFKRNGRGVDPRSVLSYDYGGFLPPGVSLVRNGTGRPELVLPASRGGTPPPASVQYVFPNFVGDKNDLVRALDDLRRTGRLP